jgi:hypothetical protein
MRKSAEKDLPITLAVVYYGLPVVLFVALTVAMMRRTYGTALSIPLLLPSLGVMYLIDRAARRLPKWPRRIVRAVVGVVGGIARIGVLIASANAPAP